MFGPVFHVTTYPMGCKAIIKQTTIPTLGKNVVVAGRSKNVGMSIAMLLHTNAVHECPRGDVTVTVSRYNTLPKSSSRNT